ncbi:unnamed protein product [Polarella glacialis]|uniref:Uncharacterized protein n=1 Tax=Polarella glacialis TaxID=89957 RepID=A0A813LYK3_POLGL|nr:unnamed protein product [Polarella glacialis]
MWGPNFCLRERVLLWLLFKCLKKRREHSIISWAKARDLRSAQAPERTSQSEYFGLLEFGLWHGHNTLSIAVRDVARSGCYATQPGAKYLFERRLPGLESGQSNCSIRMLRYSNKQLPRLV